jgi:hypothetical protein
VVAFSSSFPIYLLGLSRFKCVQYNAIQKTRFALACGGAFLYPFCFITITFSAKALALHRTPTIIFLMSKSVPYTAVFLLFLSLGLAQPRQARAQCQVVVTTADSVGCVGDTLTLTATVPTAANTLTAATAAGNSHRGNMFNLTAINNITVTGFEVSPMGITNYEIYYRVGSYVGFETSSAGWTLVGTATNVPAGPNPNFQLVTLQTPVNIPAGQTYGFYVTSTNVAVSQNYSNGTAVNNVFASDANVQFREGCGLEYPFSAGGGTFTPRVFNGRIRYTTSASYTYLWSTGQTTQTISHVLTGTGGVGVTVTQTSPACSATDTIPLTPPPPKR